VNTLNNSFRNSHGGIASLGPRMWMSDLYHSRLFGEEASDRVFTEKPESREFSDRIVCFKGWDTQ
jgi:hypothetical protein